MNNLFDDAEIISVYTRQNAIDDGVFTDVTEVAKRVGFKIPVALTTTLYTTHFKNNDPQALTNFLFTVAMQGKGKKDNMLFTEILIGGEMVKILAVVEAQSPTDSSPAINIMFPEER